MSLKKLEALTPKYTSKSHHSSWRSRYWIVYTSKVSSDARENTIETLTHVMEHGHEAGRTCSVLCHLVQTVHHCYQL